MCQLGLFIFIPCSPKWLIVLKVSQFLSLLILSILPSPIVCALLVWSSFNSLCLYYCFIFSTIFIFQNPSNVYRIFLVLLFFSPINYDCIHIFLLKKNQMMEWVYVWVRRHYKGTSKQTPPTDWPLAGRARTCNLGFAAPVSSSLSLTRRGKADSAREGIGRRSGLGGLAGWQLQVALSCAKF